MSSEKKLHYVVATAIIIKDGKYLIAKRAPHEKAFPNEWTVPGGKLSIDDYHKKVKHTKNQWYYVLENLLRREVEEEVGLQIENIKYLVSLCYIRPDGAPSLVISIYADFRDGTIKLCSDLTEHAWVTLEEAKKYDLIDGIYEELEMLDSILRGEQNIRWQKTA